MNKAAIIDIEETYDDTSRKFVPFHVEHLNTMALREQEQQEMEKLDRVRDRYEKLSQMGPASSVIHHGRVITCVGVVEHWPGNCEVWQVPSIYLAQKPFYYARLMRHWLESVAKSFECRRMQTVCVDDDLHARWMAFLKFESEGVLRQYSVLGQDYRQYARLFTWQQEP